MPNELVVRPFVENDYLAITTYCLPEEQAIYTSLPIDVIKTFEKDSDNQPFVIYLERDLIGCFALHTNGNAYTKNKNAILLKSFSIDARYQQKGLAYQSLKALPEIIKHHFPEKKEIILTVHHTNTPAINLYRKADFIDFGHKFEGEFGEEWILHFNLDKE